MSEINDRPVGDVPLSESLVEEVKQELLEIDSDSLDSHAERYEKLHNRLTEALSSIEGM